MKEFRLNRILEEMKNNSIPQMIISSPAAIFYLTGKWIESGERMIVLYINIKGDRKLIINELFPVNEDLGLDLVWYRDIDNPIEILSQYTNSNETLGIDKTWPSHFLISLMDRKGASAFVNGSPIIDRIRMIKDEEEKELMREASRINDKVMDKIVKYICPENTEKRIGNILAQLYEEEGTQGFSFEPIVAYGVNGADPHHSNDNSTVKVGEGIIIDIGCKNKFYCSDMTRTFFYGEPSAEAKKVYNIVLEANLKAIATVKPGVRFCDIDKAARDVIESYGYGKNFTHRTGHSIGLEVHDLGDVSAANEEVVKPGMIFSIEPGIYIEGKVGVRIEDLVMVTEDGCEILNKYPKELTVLS